MRRRALGVAVLVLGLATVLAAGLRSSSAPTEQRAPAPLTSAASPAPT